MQKILIYFSIFFLFNACSFDNKTGIWSDATKEVSDEKKDIRKLKKNKKYKKDGKTITEARYKAVCKWGIFNPPECDYERINDPSNEENIQFVNVFQNEELFEEEILKDTKIKINIRPTYSKILKIKDLTNNIKNLLILVSFVSF